MTTELRRYDHDDVVRLRHACKMLLMCRGWYASGEPPAFDVEQELVRQMAAGIEVDDLEQKMFAALAFRNELDDHTLAIARKAAAEGTA